MSNEQIRQETSDREKLERMASSEAILNTMLESVRNNTAELSRLKDQVNLHEEMFKLKDKQNKVLEDRLNFFQWSINTIIFAGAAVVIKKLLDAGY
jgi:phosphoribosylaminoimidazole carboxylase (NCAIR synthetase)